MKQTPKSGRVKPTADPFHIPEAPFPDKEQLLAKLLKNEEAVLSVLQQRGGEVRYAVPENVIKALAAIGTNAWKAKIKMLDQTSGEVRDEMKRVYRHIEGIFQAFQEIGLEIKDHTGDPFDYGLPLHVVTAQPTPGLAKERVLETIKPTIYWQSQMIQRGEVVIATPD